MKTLNYIFFLIALSLGLITLVPVVALAQTNVTGAVNTSAAVTTGNTGASVNANSSITLTAAEKTAITRGNTEIDRRSAALTDLNTRIQAMQKVTDAFKQGISASITAEINTLASLKAKIDADVDLATLKADIQSITSSYRVFALVLPQGRIAAAADREVTIVSMMSTLGGKLQTRIQAAQQGGADVTAMVTALNDIAAKLQDAQTQAEAAVTVSASLTPDNGDATKMKSNTAALTQARADIKTGATDLAAARKDVTSIIAGLASVKTTASASSTTQVSQ